MGHGGHPIGHAIVDGAFAIAFATTRTTAHGSAVLPPDARRGDDAARANTFARLYFTNGREAVSPSAVKTRFSTIVLLALFALRCSGSQSGNSNQTLATQPPDVASTPVEDVMLPSEPDAEAQAAPSTPDVLEQDVAPVVDASAVADVTRPDSARTTTRPSTTRPSNTTPPATTTSTPNAAGGNAAALADARAVFDRSCGRCHPGGNNRIGPRLVGRNDSEAHTRQVVRNGDGTMRPIPAARLSDGDLAKVIVFLRSIRAVR